MELIYDPSLALSLPLYELDGSSFMSKDAYGHACTVTGALWRPRGHYFDGDDFIEPSWSLAPAEGTVIAWVNISEPPGATGMILTFKQNPEATNNMFMLTYNKDDDKLGAAIYTDAYQFNLRSQATVPKSTWMMIALTVGATGNQMYKDGSAIAVDYTSGNAATTTWLDDISPDSMFIGKRRYAAADIFYKGSIGEVLVYNRALSPLEIQHNYLATKWRYK